MKAPRRPWVRYPGRQARLHDLTASPGVHLLLACGVERTELDRFGPRVTVHRIDSWSGTGITAVRPDGHVGYRSALNAHALTDWLELVGTI